MAEEIWHTIHEDLKLSKYMVSNLGRIKNIKRDIIIETRYHQRTNGYIRLGLSVDNEENRYKSRPFHIHKIVAITFLGKPESNQIIEHINGIKDDNRVENLRYVTRQKKQLKK